MHKGSPLDSEYECNKKNIVENKYFLKYEIYGISFDLKLSDYFKHKNAFPEKNDVYF